MTLTLFVLHMQPPEVYWAQQSCSCPRTQGSCSLLGRLLSHKQGLPVPSLCEAPSKDFLSILSTDIFLRHMIPSSPSWLFAFYLSMCLSIISHTLYLFVCLWANLPLQCNTKTWISSLPTAVVWSLWNDVSNGSTTEIFYKGRKEGKREKEVGWERGRMETLLPKVEKSRKQYAN